MVQSGKAGLTPRLPPKPPRTCNKDTLEDFWNIPGSFQVQIHKLTGTAGKCSLEEMGEEDGQQAANKERTGLVSAGCFFLMGVGGVPEAKACLAFSLMG